MLNRKLVLLLLLIVVLIGCATTKKDSEKTQGLDKDNQVSSKNSANSVQPVDANGNGVIDEDDVLILFRKAEDVKNKILQLYKKAGVNYQGNLTIIYAMDMFNKMEEKLTIEERNELRKYADELEILDNQGMATLKKIRPDWENPNSPVDANGNGVIDKEDISLLITKTLNYFALHIEPLLDKGGIKQEKRHKEGQKHKEGQVFNLGISIKDQ